MAATEIVLTGTYTYKPTDQPCTGYVTFKLTALGINGDRMLANPRIDSALDSQGRLTDPVTGAVGVHLFATDDTSTTPVHLTYEIVERIKGAPARVYNVVIPSDAAGGTVDISTLAPVALTPIYPYAYVNAANTFTGVQTFVDPPVVPAGAFPESAVASLVADLADIDADIAEEAARAAAAETANANAIAAETTRATNAEATKATTAALTAETNRATAAEALLIPLTQRGAANGVATLDGGGKLPTTQLPALATTETYTVASQAAMLALAAQPGDFAVRTDLNTAVFILAAADPTVLANWLQVDVLPDGSVTTAKISAGGIAESAVTGLVADLAAKAQGLTASAVKTANYAAAAADFVPVDTTAGAVTITLPTAPADKTRIGIKHVIQGGTNVVTVACAGGDVFNKAGGSTSLSLSLVNQGFSLQYKATGAIWYVVACDFSLATLDARFAADSAVVHKTATETITGNKDFTGALTHNGVAVVTARGWSAVVGPGHDTDYCYSDYASPDLALAAAVTATGTAGGRLLIREGQPLFVAPVVVSKGIELEGLGLSQYWEAPRGGTVLSWADTGGAGGETDGLLILLGDNIVKDLAIDGRYNHGANGSGLVVAGNRVWLDTLNIENCNQHGVNNVASHGQPNTSTNKFHHLWITNCHNIGLNAHGTGATDLELLDVTVGNCARGMSLSQAMAHLTDVHLWGSDHYGLSTNSTGATLVNCDIETNSEHGLIANAGQLLIVASRFYANGLAGSYPGAYLGPNSARTRVVASTFKNNHGYGLQFDTADANFCQVDDCDFFDDQGTKTQTYGIAYTNGAHDNDVSRSRLFTTDHLTGSIYTDGSSGPNSIDQSFAPVAKSATYTMLPFDTLVRATAGAGGVTMTLPAVPVIGRRYAVKKEDSAAGSVTVTCAGTIDGSASFVIDTHRASVDFMSYDGVNFEVV